MSIELKQAAQQAIDAFEAFGEADDFATLFTLTQKMNALRTAIQQAESEPVGEPVARVELMQTGGNVGLATRILEIYDPMRERLRPGDLLYTNPAPGVPVGQAPSVWNSIQIASWIGSQLMREPSMFERNAVCKFVRSLGRHPTLLKHSPKDTHPDLGVQDAVARDAERYRWLKDRNNKAQTGVGRWESDDHFTWLCDLDADAAIDAAMLAATQTKGGA